MQNANNLYYSVSLQHNKQALFIAFSFVVPAKTVAQRTAHCVLTVNNIHVTSDVIQELVLEQAIRDKAANVFDYTNKACSKLLRKNDLAASLLVS